MRAWRSILILLLKIVVALLAIAISVASFRFGVLALIAYLTGPESAIVAVLRPVGTIAAALVGYWLFVRLHERRAVHELALKPVAMIVAAVSGGALILVTILPLFALGYYELEHYRGFAGVPRVIAYIVFAALLEELVFRGVVFRFLEQYSGTVRALLIQSAIFGGLHLFNSDITFMTVLSVTLLGAFWTMVFVYSRNLWVVTCNHAAWNAVIFLSGIPLSGTQEWRPFAPFESSYHGPVWLTGGGFGPEDSILNVGFMALVFAGMMVFAIRNQWIIDGRGSGGRDSDPAATGNRRFPSRRLLQ
jgi:uncharacterized protein